MTAFTRFCWPLTVRTDSPCITRTLRPQPAEHDWQSERTQPSSPGTKSSGATSSGMSCCGLPQPSRMRPAAPTVGATFKKSRLFIFETFDLFVARQAIDAHLVLAVAIDAFAHRPAHSLSRIHGVGLVAMAPGAVDVGFHVALVAEVDVGLGFELIHAHPRRLFIACRVGRPLLDLGAVGLDVLVAHHAVAHAGESGHDGSVGVAVTGEALHLVGDVRLMR